MFYVDFALGLSLWRGVKYTLCGFTLLFFFVLPPFPQDESGIWNPSNTKKVVWNFKFTEFSQLAFLSYHSLVTLGIRDVHSNQEY